MAFSIIEATKFFPNGDYFSFEGFIGSDKGGGYFEVGQVVRPGDSHGWSEFSEFTDLDSYVVIDSVENFEGSEIDHPDYINAWGLHFDSEGNTVYGPYRDSDLNYIEGSYFSSNLETYYGSAEQAFLSGGQVMLGVSSFNEFLLMLGSNVSSTSSYCGNIACDIKPYYSGSDARDRLIGTAASEEFRGGLGADFISAGDGDDVIFLGSSNSRRPDRAIGGSGSDTYHIYSDSKALIKDFNISEDKIILASRFGDYSWISSRRGSVLINDDGEKVVALLDVANASEVVVSSY